VDPSDAGEWVKYLVALSARVVVLYGQDGQHLDYEQLQAEALREQQLMQFLSEQHHSLQLQVVRPLYRQLHPARHLESIPVSLASIVAGLRRISSPAQAR
jgi:hypothetical protein